MDWEAIEQQLVSALRGARGQDVFTGSSAAELFQLIRDGAKNMAAEEATSPEDLERAVANLYTFMAEMDVERVQLNLTEFHEETVLNARMKLCPIWPFCK
jgi:hypothetical protein